MTRKKKILIVDDEQDLAWMMEIFLKAEGFDVQRAPDGASAFQKLKAFLPDMFLLDIIMPGMDGWEIAQHLQEDAQTKSIPIVFMTAQQPVKMEVNTLHPILVKPFKEEELLTILSSVFKD